MPLQRPSPMAIINFAVDLMSAMMVLVAEVRGWSLIAFASVEVNSIAYSADAASLPSPYPMDGNLGVVTTLLRFFQFSLFFFLDFKSVKHNTTAD